MTMTVLLSGGLDSATLLAHVLDTGNTAHAVAIYYGQRHERELDAAAKLAEHYDVPFTLLELDVANALLGSALTDETVAVPDGHYAADSMSATVVPNRNALLLSLAAAYAAARDHTHVAIAVHAGDHHIYADCRPDFIAAMSWATTLGTGGAVSIAAPFVSLSKADIAARAVALCVPLAETWSCYRGGDTHCGRCGTCVERAEALHTATGGSDPTTYTDAGFWRTQVVTA